MTSENEADIEPKHRSAREVAARCLALWAVIQRSDHAETSRLRDVREWVAEQGISPFFSPAEQQFFYADDPPEADLIAFGWRAEALVSLIWALKRVPALLPLNERVAPSSLAMLQHVAADPTKFIDSAVLRPAGELHAAEEVLYNEHWRVRDAQLFDRPIPPELDPYVVYERRYALSWIVGWGTSWDDVPTDT